MLLSESLRGHLMPAGRGRGGRHLGELTPEKQIRFSFMKMRVGGIFGEAVQEEKSLVSKEPRHKSGGGSAGGRERR